LKKHIQQGARICAGSLLSLYASLLSELAYQILLNRKAFLPRNNSFKLLFQNSGVLSLRQPISGSRCLCTAIREYFSRGSSRLSSTR